MCACQFVQCHGSVTSRLLTRPYWAAASLGEVPHLTNITSLLRRGIAELEAEAKQAGHDYETHLPLMETHRKKGRQLTEDYDENIRYSLLQPVTCVWPSSAFEECSLLSELLSWVPGQPQAELKSRSGTMQDVQVVPGALNTIAASVRA